MNTKPSSLTLSPARAQGFPRLVLLALLVLAVAVGARAGEMANPEQGFRMVWPDRWQRLSEGAPAHVHLFLTTARETECLTLIIVPDTTNADPLLKGKETPQKFLPSVNGKEVLGDSPARISGQPARRLIYRQQDNGIAIMSIVVAHQRAYLLIGTFKGMKQRQAERSYDALLAGFRLEAPTTPTAPPTAATSPSADPVKPAPPSPPARPATPVTPAAPTDFGSDF